jgi:hypothetical protein
VKQYRQEEDWQRDGLLVVLVVVEVIDSRGSERRRERLPITRAGSPWELVAEHWRPPKEGARVRRRANFADEDSKYRVGGGV